MSKVMSLRRHRRQRPARRSRRTRLRRLTIAAVAAIAVVVVLRLLAIYYVDWLWFGEVSLRTVFWTRVSYGLVLGPLFGGAFFALVYGNVEVARRMAPKYRAFEGIDVVEYVHEDASRRVHQTALVLTTLLAVLWGFAAARSWPIFARAFSSVPFDVKDPAFHHDLSFYVFTLPAWQYLYTFLYATLIVALTATAAVHLVLGGVEQSSGGRKTDRPQIPRSRGDGGRCWAKASTSGSVSTETSWPISRFARRALHPHRAGLLLKAWGLLFSTCRGRLWRRLHGRQRASAADSRADGLGRALLGAALIYNACSAVAGGGRCSPSAGGSSP